VTTLEEFQQRLSEDNDGLVNYGGVRLGLDR
jgi:hypothetical protein